MIFDELFDPAEGVFIECLLGVFFRWGAEIGSTADGTKFSNRTALIFIEVRASTCNNFRDGGDVDHKIREFQICNKKVQSAGGEITTFFAVSTGLLHRLDGSIEFVIKRRHEL